jgi:hypothetical protein
MPKEPESTLVPSCSFSFSFSFDRGMALAEDPAAAMHQTIATIAITKASSR